MILRSNVVDGYVSVQRRCFLSRTAATVGIATTLVDEAQAACMPGDLTPDCIGVYKLPYLDSKDSSWINDKETMEMFAPDVRFVKTDALPETIDLAKQQLKIQRSQIKKVRDVVFKGDLQEAGVQILNIIPKVNASGLKISNWLSGRTNFDDDESEKIFNTFDASLEELLAQWNSVDVEIGQALRGQRGVTAVAQIEILADLKEVATAFDDFLKLVEINTMK